MRIGLISDTHIPDVAKATPPQVMEVFGGVDLILHAGDICEVSVLDELQSIAPVLAARGDDDYEIRDERVQEIQNLTIDGLTLYVMHNLEKAPDIVIFGHTHRDIVQTVGKSLLVNPGSATFPYYQLRLGTVALVDINAGKAEAHIVQLGKI